MSPQQGQKRKARLIVQEDTVKAVVPEVGKLDLGKFSAEQLEELLPALLKPEERKKRQKGK